MRLVACGVRRRGCGGGLVALWLRALGERWRASAGGRCVVCVGANLTDGPLAVCVHVLDGPGLPGKQGEQQRQGQRARASAATSDRAFTHSWMGSWMR